MNQTTPFFGKWESNFKNASVAKLHCGIPNYFSRMTSFNQTGRNNVDYTKYLFLSAANESLS